MVARVQPLLGAIHHGDGAGRLTLVAACQLAAYGRAVAVVAAPVRVLGVRGIPWLPTDQSDPPSRIDLRGPIHP
jgi:hypothetical protein